MDEQAKVYQKYNSFVEIRQSDPAVKESVARVRTLRENLDAYQLSSYQRRIVKKVCDDILEAPQPDLEPSFHLHDYVAQEIRQQSDNDLPRYLFYRYRYEMYPQLKVLDHFPPSLQVEPASICNYRCVFCYQTDHELTNPQNGHMGLMSLELFKEVIDQAEGQCEAVTLASRGEPLINRHIEEMLAYVAGKFVAFKINSNAWFLDERKSHAILQAGVNHLVFSVDAASEPLYSQMRVNGKLEKVLANIKQFHDIRARHYPDSKTITRVSGVKFCEEQHLDEMESFWGDLVDQVAFVTYNPWENTYQRPVNDIVTPCSDLWRRMFVWFDGMVNPCDVDYRSTLAVGNVKGGSLSDIWRNKKYSALREAHLTRQRSALSPCDRCTVV